MQDETNYLEATIQKADDGSFTAIASTNAVDRHGEVVDNNGWDLKAFKKNPVILWGHDHNEPAIGVSKKTWVEGTGKKAKLMIQPVLHDVTEKARAIKTLVDMGVIKTLSVGFKPLESPDGVTFTKNELLEVSMVNVPANAEAMTLAFKSLKSKGFDEDVMQELGIQTELIDKVVEMEDRIVKLETMVKAAPVNPQKRQTEKRISMLKVIARASDKFLENSKAGNADAKKTIKVIKKATEILTVAEKENL
jgi:HK97 family phage prohead protease